MAVNYLPIKAVSFVNDNIIVAASGRFLEFWCLQTRALVSAPTQISDRDSISGIVILPSARILVFAGRQILLLNYAPSFEILKDQTQGFQFSDRIVHVEPLGDDQAIVTLSHGQTLLFQLSTCCIKQTFSLEQDYLIYSSSAISVAGRLFVALGTVFDGVEIFELDKQQLKLVKRIHLKGHQGSIFGLAFHASGNHLVSCSDDRTVRLWKLPLLTDLKEPIELCADKVMVGHRSRVWRVLFGHDMIFSAAEDSTVRLWDLDGTSYQVLAGHRGLNIWALAWQKDRLVSGGDDCSLRLWSLDRSDQVTLDCIDANDHGEPKCFDFMDSPNHLAVLYANGFVSGLDCIIPLESLERQATFCASSAHCLYIFGNLAGQLHIQYQNVHQQINLFTSKVAFLNILSTSSNGFSVFAQSGNGTASLVSLDYSASMPTTTIVACELPETVASSTHMLSTGELLLGTRDGRVLLYQGTEKHFSPLARISQDAVTCIRSMPDEASILITDRAGNLSCYHLNATERTLIMSWSSKVTNSWLEQVDILANGRILVAGFKGTEFFLKCYQTGQIIMQLTTGGAHRFWRLQIASNGEWVYFGFIRLGKLHWCVKSLQVDLAVILKAPLHGAEIRTVAIATNGLVATGGEDGCLVVTRMTTTGTDFRAIASTTAHRSGIKAVCWHDDLLFSAGSSEELLCHKLLSDGNLQFLARAAAFSQVRDVRIMDISLEIENDGTVLMAAASSDSFIRTWRFNVLSREFVFLSAVEAHPGHCVLSIKLCKLDGALFIVSGGTDGLLCVSCDPDNLRLACQSKIHQSGINSIAIVNSMIASGGDDGKLSIQSIELVDGSSPMLQILDSVPEADHSTITGLIWRDEATLCSVSIDQLIKIWVLVDNKTLRRRRAAVTDVADPAAISIMDSNVVIVGAGMQLLPLDRIISPS